MTTLAIVLGVVGVVIAGLLAWVGSLTVTYLKSISEGVLRLESRLEKLDEKKADRGMVIDCQAGCSKEMGHIWREVEQLREAKA